MPRVYAYVTSETCCYTHAELPGHIGKNGERISQHGDHHAWTRGKRETLAMIASAGGYHYQAARAVAWLLGWSDDER